MTRARHPWWSPAGLPSTPAFVSSLLSRLLYDTDTAMLSAWQASQCSCCALAWPLHFQKKVNVSWGQKSVDAIKPVWIFDYINVHALRQGFPPRRSHSKVRVNAGRYLNIPDADRLPNAADSPRSSPDRFITIVKLKNIVKKIFSKMKKPWTSVEICWKGW